MNVFEHKALEIVLKNKSLFSFFDKMPYGIIITDAQGLIIYYNKSQSQIDSLEPEEVLGKKCHQIYGPHPEPALIGTCLKTGEPVIDFVGLYRTYKGKIINSAHTVFPIIYEGKICGALCLIVEMKKLISANKVSTLKSRPRMANEVCFDTLVGQSLKFLRAVELGRLTAHSPSPVMLAAETGCGKEMFAKSIHEASDRFGRPFLAINCAAIPHELLEGILFGTVKGAFTGAVDRIGLFEQANNGTLFFDEIDSMPLELQPKLLRVLQEKTVKRVGSTKEEPFDIKIISSISADTESVLAAGRMRLDLFYRLGVVVINLPPLRERLDDLPLLVNYFIMKHNYILGRKIALAEPEVLATFLSYHWPGNIRELEHVIEGSMNLITNEEILTRTMLPEHFQTDKKRILSSYSPSKIEAIFRPEPSKPTRSSATSENFLSRKPLGHNNTPIGLKEAEKLAIIDALTYTQGSVTKAGQVLGLSRQLLTHKIKKHAINRKDYII
ncbi:MAG: sigma 54-interacting transcriptional regulator [Deltaproteobacteria bacterium]|jgi:arginine utilization regulatory protein|nr:sigma 54-interacting transcriptional regulator [Deltaproteobacteria bacterium]